MRFLIATLLLASSLGVSAAEVIGTMANNAGGEILLTNDKCGVNGNGRSIVATFSGGQVWTRGCAIPLRPRRLLVEWNDGRGVILPMTGWAPDATDRSLKSFSDAELDMLIVRTSWFEGKAVKPIPASAPATPPEMRRPLNELDFIVTQGRLAGSYTQSRRTP